MDHSVSRRKVENLVSAGSHQARKLARRFSLKRLVRNVWPSKRRKGVRRFVDPSIGREGLFRTLNDRNVNYVVLRWFENVPEWPEGEDIDLLIDVDDLHLVDDLFVTNSREIPCDVYGTGPAKNACWKGLSYYPPYLAEQIVQSRTLYRDLCYIPDEDHYFLSLAYHALYHKGSASGLPWDDSDAATKSSKQQSDHDYADRLKAAAPAKFIDTPMTMKGLECLLTSQSWNPPVDTLRRYASLRPELAQFLPPPIENKDGELIVVLFRQSAVDNHILEEAISLFRQKHRLEVVGQHELSTESAKLASKHIRGGNWDEGPFPQSGGLPAVALALFDYHPVEPTPAEKEQYPYIQNRRVLFKKEIRRLLNKRLPKSQWNNCVHSSDDELEGLEYLEIIDPSFHAEVQTQLSYLRRHYKTPEPVIRSLRKPANRSKTELVEWNGKEAVRKTFRPSFKRFCDREIFIYQTLGPKLETVPELLDFDEYSFVLPKYENCLAGLSLRKQGKLLKPYANQVIELLRATFALERAIIDFHPGNLILTPGGDLYFVDFEFAQPIPDWPSSFMQSPDLVGLPPGFSGDRPSNLPENGYSYDDFWKPIFQCSLEELIRQCDVDPTSAAEQSLSISDLPPGENSDSRLRQAG
ncbi:hypothetical protein LOC70_13850 [Rhodopirellula sp. JC737]|nr:hypothetical protein [Rhodopirellula sp. JC737]